MEQNLVIPDGLERVDIPPAAGDVPVPHFVDLFIRDAEDRAEEYDARIGGGSFIPSDTRYAFQVLQWLLRSGALTRGASLLEWGSGQGVLAIFASLMGLDAMGVEIDEVLVREATLLAARYDSKARFVHGSYDSATPGMKTYTAAKYQAVYVYPWPGEERYFLHLFLVTAKIGALLIMGLGPEDILVVRKTG